VIQPFACSVCQLKFSSEFLLHDHQRTNHKKGFPGFSNFVRLPTAKKAEILFKLSYLTQLRVQFACTNQQPQP
jgi:hypothetical protein